MESPTPKSLPLLGKLFHPSHKRFIPIWLALIAYGVPAKANETTGTSLAQPKAVEAASPGLGLYPAPRTTAVSIDMPYHE